jgi:hypothetical protein
LRHTVIIRRALTVLALALLVSAPLLFSSPESPAVGKLVLKNGTVYLLKEPPRFVGSRVVFTTTDGKLLSLDESEIASIGGGEPTPVPNRYDQEDSRALGAIAREQRDAKGKNAEVAPYSPPKRTPKPAKTPAPKPKPKPKPTRVTPKPTPAQS